MSKPSRRHEANPSKYDAHLGELELLLYVADDSLALFTAEGTGDKLRSHFTGSSNGPTNAHELADLIHFEVANGIDQGHVVESDVEVTSDERGVRAGSCSTAGGRGGICGCGHIEICRCISSNQGLDGSS